MILQPVLKPACLNCSTQHAPASRLSSAGAPTHAIRLRRQYRGQHQATQGPALVSASQRSAQGEGEVAAPGPCWHALRAPAIWEGTEDEALRSPTSSFRSLSPTWKVLLLSDGSVTRHLQLLTGATTRAVSEEGPATRALRGAQQSQDCFEMLDIGNNIVGLPVEVQSIPGPRVQRQVLLRPSALLALEQAPCRALSARADRRHQAAFNQAAGPGDGLDGTRIASPAAQPLVYACSWWNADQAGQYLQDRSQPIWNSLSQGHVELYREVQHVYHGHSSILEGLLGCPGPFWGRQYFFWHGGKPLTLIYEVFSPLLQEYLGSCFASGTYDRIQK